MVTDKRTKSKVRSVASSGSFPEIKGKNDVIIIYFGRVTVLYFYGIIVYFYGTTTYLGILASCVGDVSMHWSPG